MYRRRLLAGLAASVVAAPWARAAQRWRVLAGGGAAAAGPGTEAELVYQGTHILTHGAFRALLIRYGQRSGLRTRVLGGGCDDGIAAVRRGIAHFGGLCCPVAGSPAEGMPWLVVARDLKAVVVHPDNPVDALSMEELAALAQGRIRRWRTLGGPDRPVALVVRRHCREYREPVRTALVGANDWSRWALYVDTDQQLVETVSRFPTAVGVVSWVFAAPAVEAGRLRVVALQGVRPRTPAVRTRGYPLTGPLNVVYARWLPGVMGPFLDFLYGPEGRALIGQRLLPVSAEEAGWRRRA